MIQFLRKASMCPVKYSTRVFKKLRVGNDSMSIHNWSKRRIKTTLFILFTVILLILMNSCIQPVRFIFVHQSINSTCLLPDIDPFDKSVMQYIWHPKPIVCEPSPSIVYIDKMGKLQLNRSEISNKNNHFDCFYRLIMRSSDNDVTLSHEVKLLLPVYIPSDYVNVKCFGDQRLLYDIVLHNVDFKTVRKNKEILNENDKCLSVLMFGLDSVSRLAAERKLPKTMNLIKKLNGYNFKGYTSIAAITYPNLMASLTGKTAYSNELPKLDPRKEFTDKYPFIWKNFSQKGYVTMFSEDFPEISMFNYMQKGFKDSPVDHYLRPYYIARKKLHPVQSNLDQVFMFLEDKDIKMKKYSSLCYKSRPKHAIHIDHYKNFVSTYKGNRKFGLSWLTEIGHDYMNFLEHADDDIEQMIQYFYNEGLFKNTIFILFGDHGPRTDEIRNTAIGRIEERMPLLSIIIPKQIKNTYPHIHTNLQDNENKLTSPFDLHETFVDILNENFTLSEKVMTRPYPRGISLLRKIPKDRTCSDAAIAEHVCACYTSHKVSVNSRMIDIGKFVVNSINIKLEQFKDTCSTLSLYQVKEAQEIKTGLEYREDFSRKTLLNLFYQPEVESEQRFVVLIETTPGHSLFEGTVSSKNNELTLLGDVSRTNRYNNQSHCIAYKTLKHLCYCKDLTL
ncbi:uncharacterized protein LOC134697144 isoform X1 [Mytilus trossulus]|uniref:uncharacterized protein LOC134697144 isoform X1 n=1 Tax=Mytilus trossulus TaxID=6551 RepID=UPI003006C0B4